MHLRALCAVAALTLVSCSLVPSGLPGFGPYRIEIQQGNFVSQEMVSQLKLGMTRDQVRFVLGTPLITDGFHADRWDFVFRRQRDSSSPLEQRKVAVFFEDGKLKRIEGDLTSAASSDAAPIKLPDTKAEQPRSAAPAEVAEPGQASVAVQDKPAVAVAARGASAPN